MATIKKKAYAGKTNQEQEIVTLAHNISDFIDANRKTLMIVVSVLLILVVIGAGYAVKQSLDERSAGPLFAAAYEQYNPTTGAPPDYNRALDMFRNVQKKYPSSRSGAAARLYAANVLVNMDRNDEALKEYQALVKDLGKEELLPGLAYQRMGYLYSQSGNTAEAVKAFERAEALLGPGVATYELAKLYEASGNATESENKYKTISDKLAGTTWAMEASGKVQKIQSLPVPDSQEPDKKSE